jgi:hypothetical protein
MEYLLICFIYTIEVPQPQIFEYGFITKSDANNTMLALKELEENTDCKIIRIRK